MAPNLIVRTAYCSNDQANEEGDQNSIRTDFILQNVYSYLIRNTINFEAVSARNPQEREMLSVLTNIVDSFKLNYLNAIRSLCHQVVVTRENVNYVITAVSNEVFSEGIDWSRIVSLFVFIGELTLLCIANLGTNIVDVMYESLCRFVKERLVGWIEDHGSWEGLKTLRQRPPASSYRQLVENASNKGWARSLLHGTVRILGTFAHIANATGQSFP